jgi:hypothetical protein
VDEVDVDVCVESFVGSEVPVVLFEPVNVVSALFCVVAIAVVDFEVDVDSVIVTFPAGAFVTLFNGAPTSFAESKSTPYVGFVTGARVVLVPSVANVVVIFSSSPLASNVAGTSSSPMRELVDAVPPGVAEVVSIGSASSVPSALAVDVVVAAAVSSPSEDIFSSSVDGESVEPLEASDTAAVASVDPSAGITATASIKVGDVVGESCSSRPRIDASDVVRRISRMGRMRRVMIEVPMQRDYSVKQAGLGIFEGLGFG